MKHSKSALLLAFSFFLLFTQCQREISGGIIPPTPVDPPVVSDPITTTLQGNITDENKTPSPGVLVTAGGKSATTDINGYFRLEKVVLDKKLSAVTATKAGYFKSVRSFSATGATNHISIQLIPKKLVASFLASSGGTAILSNKSQIQIPANGVVNAVTGAAYTGKLNLYAAYIDPLSDNISRTIPGSFTAMDKNGKRVVLSSYGMMAVELETEGGEKLQLKNGSPATLTMPVIKSATANATIPLWYLDETTGLWKEEGEATKQGSNYVGTVAHFSFWNCDYPFSAAIIDLKLAVDNKPLAYATVRITAGEASAMGITDSVGVVSGYVPTGQNLKMEVLNGCHTVILSKDFAPISNNTSLGTFAVPPGTTGLLTVTGTLLNCSNAPVAFGKVIISVDNTTRHLVADANGQFIASFIACYTPAKQVVITGIDTLAQQQGSTSVPLSLPLIALGNIYVCGTSSAEFLRYNIDGNDYEFSSQLSDAFDAYVDTSSIVRVTARDANNQRFMSFLFLANKTGTYPLDFFSLIQSPIGGNQIVRPFDVKLDTYPQVGSFFEGTLNGAYNDSDSSAGTIKHTLTASFRIRRDQ